MGCRLSLGSNLLENQEMDKGYAQKGGLTMYINPVLVGILGTIMFELVACIIYAVWSGRKK